MPTDREAILTRVRQALAPLPRRAPLPDWEAEWATLRQQHAAGADPWTRFAQRLQSLNGTPLTDIAALVDLLEKNQWYRGYCDPVLWPRLQAAFDSRFTVETTFDRTRVDDYAFGITRATGAIVETGTLILTDADSSRRLAALTPWVHVAVLHPENLWPDLPSAVAALPNDPNVIWCTGPSRTADVEGILIEGVHGPGVQVALLLASPV